VCPHNILAPRLRMATRFSSLTTPRSKIPTAGLSHLASTGAGSLRLSDIGPVPIEYFKLMDALGSRSTPSPSVAVPADDPANRPRRIRVLSPLPFHIRAGQVREQHVRTPPGTLPHAFASDAVRSLVFTAAVGPRQRYSRVSVDFAFSDLHRSSSVVDGIPVFAPRPFRCRRAQPLIAYRCYSRPSHSGSISVRMLRKNSRALTASITPSQITVPKAPRALHPTFFRAPVAMFGSSGVLLHKEQFSAGRCSPCSLNTSMVLFANVRELNAFISPEITKRAFAADHRRYARLDTTIACSLPALWTRSFAKTSASCHCVWSSIKGVGFHYNTFPITPR